MKTIAGLALLLVLFTLSACNTPYPNGSPIEGAKIGGNPYRRGTPEFCDAYGRQTAANRYESARDSDSSFGSFGANAIAEQQARRTGEDAYRRCLAGRTN